MSIATHKICWQCGVEYGPQPDRMGNFRRSKFCGNACYNEARKYTDEKALALMWSKVDRNGPNGCWIYTGNVNNMGYGAMVWRGNNMMAVHRLVYQLAHGNLPGPHVFCLHHCDTPRCCNPAHIFLGDDKANTADKVAKGRHLNHIAKCAVLTEQQVLEIRSAFRRFSKCRTNIAELCARYPTIKWGTIYKAATGISWKHLPGAHPVCSPPSTGKQP